MRVDVTEINPSLSVTAGSVLRLILSPSSGGDQVKEGEGTPDLLSKLQESRGKLPPLPPASYVLKPSVCTSRFSKIS